mmetsp:Transcript_15507/g.41663  ORF Transcript_15507/g.41663 Transcript_15507/m.41663 type:complete len:228 (-) Transcript_15507:480-1163(-)
MIAGVLSVAEPGEVLHELRAASSAFAGAFPEAPTNAIPAEVRRAIASSYAALGLDPELTDATTTAATSPPRAATSRMTQSIPDTSQLTRPRLSQSSTRTAIIGARYATPTVRPAAMAATCVPCPWQSSESKSSSSTFRPWLARPLNSSWSMRTPVSRMYMSTPAAPVATTYRPSSGSSRWSIRSRPHETPGVGIDAVDAVMSNMPSSVLDDACTMMKKRTFAVSSTR